MSKKYYAVRKGRIPGIYRTWDECKAQVDGFSGAEYKSFPTEDAANDFINGIASPLPSSVPQTHQEPEPTVYPTSQEPAAAIAYVDGSYDVKTKRFSYGCIIFHQQRKLTFSKAFRDEEMATMRNVAGEIAGALTAMKWCVENGIKTLHLYYDYEGIEKWCTGVWKSKNPNTQNYKKKYDVYTIQNNLTVVFHKVKGHSGDKYNEEADRLAKRALGIGYISPL